MIWLRFRAWLQEVDETSGGVGVVVFEEVQAGISAPARRMRSADTSRILPRGPRRTASRTKACPWARSSGTSPARATPTSRR